MSGTVASQPIRKSGTLFTPNTKDINIYELTKKYWNKEDVKFNITHLEFEKKIGYKPDITVKKGRVIYDYLSRSQYFGCLFEKLKML